METEPYQKAIRKRKVWIEPLFAEGKLWHGMRRFRMRTLEKVNTEALMTATGQNIKRLLAFGGSAPKKSAQAAALRPPDGLRPDLAHGRSWHHRRQRRIDPTLFNTLERFGDCGLRVRVWLVIRSRVLGSRHVYYSWSGARRIAFAVVSEWCQYRSGVHL